MEITQCLHTAILVSDLERSENFYGNVLGLEKIDRSLKYPGTWYQISQFQLHLILHPGLAVERHNEKWGRNPHFALGVTNLDAAKEKLLANNCPVQMSASGRAALFTQDPDSNIVELTQVSAS
ncbi:MAG: VOC family protein [Kastovskya adunca ATA6-11-RM4]|jgi:catechol 2,3-dioxygenase-like lactoylglutathione lyase family enzyme|nr:VOC family protein [Kastovskya adunca ATA6-11-RM4]